MCCSINAHSRSEKRPITNLDQTAIEDTAVEVGVETFTDLDVASVVELTISAFLPSV